MTFQVRARELLRSVVRYYSSWRGVTAAILVVLLGSLVFLLANSPKAEALALYSLLVGGFLVLLASQRARREGRLATDSWHMSLTPKPRLRTIRDPLTGKILILPSAGYHVEEAGPLAKQLGASGLDPIFLADERRWQEIRAGMRRFDFPTHQIPEVDDWMDGVAAIVVFNDWGEYAHIVKKANELGIPTFAKVEGAQDFEDDDVDWKRNPYRTAAHILCQGRNDIAALPDQDCYVVGGTRLERIWHEPPRPIPEPLAVINVNFTYGVLEDAQDIFLSTAIAACRRAGIPMVASLHPAHRGQLDHRIEVATQPMSHLLTKASVLISRFSTVPFEAMARGVPFVYHNPHDERVPTFKRPDGAFPVSKDARSLAEAIAESLDRVGTFRDRCRDFFLNQVDIIPDTRPEDRAAKVISTLMRSAT